MSIKSLAAQLFAKIIHNKTQKWASNPVVTQQKVLEDLIRQAKNTQFGKEHHFSQIITTEDYAKQVPIRDYEELKPYVDRVVQGEENVLWKGKPIYFISEGKGEGKGKGKSINFISDGKEKPINFISEEGKATGKEKSINFISKGKGNGKGKPISFISEEEEGQ